MQTSPFSLTLLGFAVGAYCLAFIGYVVFLPARRKWITDGALLVVMIGWTFHFASVLARALEAGHWPLGNMYEYSTGIALVMVATYIVIAVRSGQRLIGGPVMMLAVALLGVAYMLYVPPGQLVPALHSYWLTIHVTSMATSSGILTFSFLFGMLYLIRHRADQRMLAIARGDGVSPGPGAEAVAQSGRGFSAMVQRTLPSAATLDSWSYRFVMLGFPIWTFGVICGAIWGEHAWGRYWGWDPKETFAFITWVIFAIYLHARVTHGWREVRAAVITAIGFVSIGFTLYAVNLWIAGLHSYAKV